MAAPAIGLRPGVLPQSFSVDWSHPIAQGLTSLVVPQSIARTTDVVGNPLTVSGATTNARAITIASTQFVTLGTVGAATRWTALALARPTATSAGNAQGLVTRVGSGSTHNFYIGFQAATGNFEVGHRESAGGAYRFTTGVAQTLNREQLFVGTYDGTNIQAWRDGSRVGVVAATDPNAGVFTLAIGGVADGALYRYVGDVRLAATWNRALSANEIATLTADPFCFLRY